MEDHQFINICVVGFADSKTVEMMEYPRCGAWDVLDMGDMAKRKKRYAAQGTPTA